MNLGVHIDDNDSMFRKSMIFLNQPMDHKVAYSLQMFLKVHHEGKSRQKFANALNALL